MAHTEEPYRDVDLTGADLHRISPVKARWVVNLMFDGSPDVVHVAELTRTGEIIVSVDGGDFSATVDDSAPFELTKIDSTTDRLTLTFERSI